MIKIKNKFLNPNKVLSLEYATSEKNNKNYCIINIDSINIENAKIFMEVTNQDEFNQIINEVKNQINK
jgi:hypothetical protein